ncbi:MAG: hypothetical protein LBN95_04785 [Prevotellaceae bacterium]|jgi:hypothetical protein|nr:hypothetical protein [Prevotellaceae bacterium]
MLCGTVSAQKNFTVSGNVRDNGDGEDLIGISVCSITQEYAAYIQNVREELQWSIPIFSGPPANVQTNISGGAVGFFTAYSKQSWKVVFE